MGTTVAAGVFPATVDDEADTGDVLADGLLLADGVRAAGGLTDGPLVALDFEALLGAGAGVVTGFAPGSALLSAAGDAEAEACTTGVEVSPEDLAAPELADCAGPGVSTVVAEFDVRDFEGFAVCTAVGVSVGDGAPLLAGGPASGAFGGGTSTVG